MSRATLSAYVLVCLCAALGARAATTMNESNKWAWSEGSGWINCRTDATNGAGLGRHVCSNYMYSPATGWIYLGDGAPTNGWQYTNDSSDDYGVNHDGKGNLRGYAWSTSAGWISFEDLGAPKVLELVLKLKQYPILSRPIRERMRQEIFRRGIISRTDFENEVRKKARESQIREGLNDPMLEETSDTWTQRLAVIRDDLTDYGRAYLALALHRAGRKEEAKIVAENFENTVVIDKDNGDAYWGHLNGWWYWYRGSTETTS